MIKQLLTAVTLLVWGGPALADVMGIGRVGALGGVYLPDLEVVVRNSDGDVLNRQKEDSSRTSLGVLAGYSIAWGMFFGDLGVEYQSTGSKEAPDGSTASFDRTDVLPSVGVFLPGDFNLSVGYRLAWQGDGLFDDRFYRETGPFVGVGFPSFGVVGDWMLSPSIAVNFTKLKFDDSDTEPNFTGVSLRGAMSRPGSPHAFGLRIQRFSGDETDRFPDPFPAEPALAGGSAKFDITETYIHFFYQFAFLGMGD